MHESETETDENVLHIVLDGADSSHNVTLDLDSLPLAKVAELANLIPSIRTYYGKRLLLSDTDPDGTIS
jgi:hypothetical protein